MHIYKKDLVWWEILDFEADGLQQQKTTLGFSVSQEQECEVSVDAASQKSMFNLLVGMKWCRKYFFQHSNRPQNTIDLKLVLL